MPQKLKITLGVLLLVAGFLVVRLGLYFNKSVKTATSADISGRVLSAEEENPFATDSDNDGIPDIEEAYYRTDPFNPDTDGDGFLDGEEIAAGCSPAIPRPNDCLGNVNKNLTSMVSNLLAGGLYSGDLKNPATNENFQKNLDQIKLQVYLDFEDSFVNKIGATDLKTSGDNSFSAVNDYLSSVVTILNKTILRPQQDQISEIKKALNLYLIAPQEKNAVFADLYDLFNQSTNDLVNLNVPSDWAGLHLKLVNSVNRFATTYEYIHDPLTDPVASILAFEKLVAEFSNAQSILNEFRSRAENIK